MGRQEYDDWGFMGEVQKEQRLKSEAKRARQTNASKNAFVFLCSVCILALSGLVAVYSASFPVAVNNGLNHYYYLINQMVYLGIGLLLAIFVNVLPESGIKVLCPICLLSSIVLLGVDLFFGKSLVSSVDTIGFVFVSCVMYMSLFFSNRDNRIQSLKQLIVPTIGALFVLVLLLLKKSFSYAVYFLCLNAVMFAVGGLGITGIIILVLYLLVPSLVIIFSKSDILLSVARFLFPGAESTARSAQVATIKEAISSGSWFGKGLGMGEYKIDKIEDLAGRCIFANICEEIGFVGIFTIFVVFLVLAFTGYRVAKLTRKQNGFVSNLALGCTTIVIWQMIANILWVLGILPGDGLSMPFFSYGMEIIPIMLACGLIYKSSKCKPSTLAADDSLENLSNELKYPEQYEFEKI